MDLERFDARDDRHKSAPCHAYYRLPAASLLPVPNKSLTWQGSLHWHGSCKVERKARCGRVDRKHKLLCRPTVALHLKEYDCNIDRLQDCSIMSAASTNICPEFRLPSIGIGHGALLATSKSNAWEAAVQLCIPPPNGKARE